MAEDYRHPFVAENHDLSYTKGEEAPGKPSRRTLDRIIKMSKTKLGTRSFFEQAVIVQDKDTGEVRMHLTRCNTTFCGLDEMNRILQRISERMQLDIKPSQSQGSQPTVAEIFQWCLFTRNANSGEIQLALGNGRIVIQGTDNINQSFGLTAERLIAEEQCHSQEGSCSNFPAHHDDLQRRRPEDYTLTQAKEALGLAREKRELLALQEPLYTALSFLETENYNGTASTGDCNPDGEERLVYSQLGRLGAVLDLYRARSQRDEAIRKSSFLRHKIDTAMHQTTWEGHNEYVKRDFQCKEHAFTTKTWGERNGNQYLAKPLFEEARPVHNREEGPAGGFRLKYEEEEAVATAVNAELAKLSRALDERVSLLVAEAEESKRLMGAERDHYLQQVGIGNAALREARDALGAAERKVQCLEAEIRNAKSERGLLHARNTRTDTKQDGDEDEVKDEMGSGAPKKLEHYKHGTASILTEQPHQEARDATKIKMILKPLQALIKELQDLLQSANTQLEDRDANEGEYKRSYGKHRAGAVHHQHTRTRRRSRHHRRRHRHRHRHR